MSRFGLKLLKRQASFLLLGAFLVVVEAVPARGAGCHAPDRPALGTRLSWEADLDLKRTPDVPAPPVLTHPSCPGEVPHLHAPMRVDSGSAPDDPNLYDPSELTGYLKIPDDLARLDPHRGRVDRPPRAPA